MQRERARKKEWKKKENRRGAETAREDEDKETQAINTQTS